VFKKMLLLLLLQLMTIMTAEMAVETLQTKR